MRLYAASFLAAALGTLACAGDISGNDNEGARDDGFAVYRDRVELLPYQVRFKRIADLAGVDEADPSLDVMRENRLLLGDHDFASGVRPNLSWDAETLATWVRAVEPVCASDAIRERYPTFPADLAAFMGASYGRSVDGEEAAELWRSTAELSGDRRYQITCAAVLSTLEFVAR